MKVRCGGRERERERREIQCFLFFFFGQSRDFGGMRERGGYREESSEKTDRKRLLSSLSWGYPVNDVEAYIPKMDEEREKERKKKKSRRIHESTITLADLATERPTIRFFIIPTNVFSCGCDCGGGGGGDITAAAGNTFSFESAGDDGQGNLVIRGSTRQ